MKEDRLIAGGIAGIAGSLACDIIGTIYKSLGWTDVAFYDNATILLTRQIYSDKGILGLILSIITHVAVCIIFGVVFSFIIKFTSKQYLYFKGLGFSLVLWILLHGFGTIFDLPYFANMTLNAAYASLSTAFLYGFVIVLTLEIIDKKSQLL